jgi:ADP-ribose pyrophosphatase
VDVGRGEDPAAAAIRELQEETGFIVDRSAFRNAPLLVHLDPSLTSDSEVVFFAEVDGDDPRNADGARQQRLDEDEHIHVKLVPVDGLLAHLEERRRAGYVIDAKVFVLAMALSLTVQL